VIQEERSIVWEKTVWIILSGKKNFIWTCILFWMITEIELFESTNKLGLRTVIKRNYLLLINSNCNLKFKWEIHCTETTNLLQFTINVPKSHRQPQRTLQLVCEDRVLFVSVDLHVSLRCQQHAKCKLETCLLYPHLFANFTLYPTPQNKL
jgi:hypothetical protein